MNISIEVNLFNGESKSHVNFISIQVRLKLK